MKPTQPHTPASHLLEHDEEAQNDAHISREARISAPTQVIIDPNEIWRITWEIAMLTGSLTLTDTFAFRNILFPFLATKVDSSPKNTAAIALIIPMINTMAMGFSLLFSINLDGAPLVSDLNALEKGSDAWHKKRREIVALYGNGIFISMLIAPICMIVMLASGPLLHDVFQQKEDIAYRAQEFLQPTAAMVPAVFSWMCALQMTSSFNSTKVTPIAPISFAIGAFLAYGLGLGVMGMPKWGMMGIFTGYIVEAYLTAAAYNGVILFSSDFKDIEFRKVCSDANELLSRVKQQLSKGAAIAITVTTELWFVFYLSMLSDQIGTTAQEAFALAIQYIVFTDVLIVNAAVGTAMLLGKFSGDTPNHPHAFIAMRYGLLFSLALCSIIPIACFVAPQGLMKIFNNEDEEVEILLKQLVPYVSLGLIFNAVSYVCLLTSRVLGDRWNSTYERVGSLVFGMVLALFLLKFTNLGIQSLGIGYCFGMFLSVTTLWRRDGKMQDQYCSKHHILPPPMTLPPPPSLSVTPILARIGWNAASSRSANSHMVVSNIEMTSSPFHEEEDFIEVDDTTYHKILCGGRNE